MIRARAHPYVSIVPIAALFAVGGDVDTTAAMAGAISGAYNGLAHLPGDLMLGLNDRDTWRFEDLVVLAHDAQATKLRLRP